MAFSIHELVFDEGCFVIIHDNNFDAYISPPFCTCEDLAEFVTIHHIGDQVKVEPCLRQVTLLATSDVVCKCRACIKKLKLSSPISDEEAIRLQDFLQFLRFAAFLHLKPMPKERTEELEAWMFAKNIDLDLPPNFDLDERVKHALMISCMHTKNEDGCVAERKVIPATPEHIYSMRLLAGAYIETLFGHFGLAGPNAHSPLEILRNFQATTAPSP